MVAMELTILRELFSKKEFAESVVPYLRTSTSILRKRHAIYSLYEKFYNKFHTIPSIQAIRIGLDSVTTFNDREAKLRKTHSLPSKRNQN
jgi:hypothetical protein